MERFIRELRRGTKVRDHKFPKEEAVYKLLYLESERQEGRWARAYVVEHGRIVLHGPPRAVLEDPRIREAYLSL